MDSLPEDEIEAIWQRQKKYIDIDKIKSTDRQMVQEEIKQLMLNERVGSKAQSNPQANGNFLVDRGFPERVVQSDKVLREIYSNKVGERKINGKTRFILKKGVSFRAKSGRSFKGGQFLSGKTRDDAINDIIRKSEES